MVRGGKILVWMLGSSVWIAAAQAIMPDSAESPYHGIVERNVFGLKPPAPPVADAPPPPPPVKITLTGITTILGNKRALLNAQAPGKPPDSYILAENQRESDIEVVVIDEKAGTVQVNNHGIVQTLDFQTEGAKPQNNVLPPGFPTPANNIPPPGSLNPNPAPPTMRTIPPRLPRLPMIPGRSPLAADVPAAVPPAVQPNAQPQNNPLSPEEQEILKEVQRLQQPRSPSPR